MGCPKEAGVLLPQKNEAESKVLKINEHRITFHTLEGNFVFFPVNVKIYRYFKFSSPTSELRLQPIFTPRHACAARGQVIALGLDYNIVSAKKF